MHCIETVAQAYDRHADPRTPVTGNGDANPVLTITDGDHNAPGEVRILFQNGPYTGAGIVINPWEHDRKVAIVGEDLFALRELLAELPESAFARPADPVEKPERWTDGDVVRHSPSGKLYERQGGEWMVVNEPDWKPSSFAPITDHIMSTVVDRHPDNNKVLLQQTA